MSGLSADMIDLREQDADRFLVEFRMQYRLLDNGILYGGAHEPWQEEHVFGPIDAGKHVCLQLPRGHDKTGAVAWCALTWLFFGEPGEQIVVAAADQDQARLVLEELDAQVSRLQPFARALTITRNVVTLPARKAKLTVISSDAGSSYGLKPTKLVIEELHAWSGARAEELFDSLWGSIAKRRAQVVCITNAGSGFDWKYERREMFRREAEENPDRWHFWAPDGWVAEWSSGLRDLLAKGMHPLRRKRFLDNVWLEEAEGAFVTTMQAESCVAEYDPRSFGRFPHIAQGIDLGLTHDAAVVSVVGMDREGRCALLSMQVFPGSKEDPVLIEAVEEAALRNMATWGPRWTLIDPWQMASTLQRRGPELRAEQFVFSAAHLQQLTDAFWQKCSGGMFRFYRGAGRAFQGGEEWDLLRELKSAVVRETSYGTRIDHRAGGYSDRLISVGMAVWQLAQNSLAVPVSAGPDAAEDAPTWQERRGSFGFGLSGARPFASRLDRIADEEGARLADARAVARAAVDHVNRHGI